MRDTALHERVIGVLGGLVVVGTIGCILLTVAAGVTFAIIGGGTGYFALDRRYLLASVILSGIIGAIVGVLHHRSSLHEHTP